VNPATGTATLIGLTGIPAIPFTPQSLNKDDGTLNVFEETLFGAAGKLYATFDTNRLDPETGHLTHEIPNNLYQINPATGHATLIAPTAQTLSAVVAVNGTVYAFNIEKSQVVSLNLTNGNISFVSNLDPTDPAAG